MSLDMEKYIKVRKAQAEGVRTVEELKEKSDIVIDNDTEIQEIEKILNNFAFYRSKDVFMFNGDDEKLFELLSDDLSMLKDKATVYYSDRFKERRIYGASSLNASITEGRGNYLEFSFNIENVSEDEYKKIIAAFKDNRRFFKLKDESFIDLKEKLHYRRKKQEKNAIYPKRPYV